MYFEKACLMGSSAVPNSFETVVRSLAGGTSNKLSTPQSTIFC